MESWVLAFGGVVIVAFGALMILVNASPIGFVAMAAGFLATICGLASSR